MEFDKSKILTVVTADQAKVGQKGWFAILPKYIQENMSGGQEPSVLSNIDLDSRSPFTREGGYAWPLFYPAPTYAERQAEWIKENNVKVGTKVRFTKGFEDSADGSGCFEHKDAKGVEGVVKEIFYTYLSVAVVRGGYHGWAVPFTALEVIKEPTYRPFHDDELNDIVGKVVVQNHTGNAMLIIKIVDSETGKVVSLGGSQKRNAQQLLDGWTHKNGEPCGVREEA